MVGILKRYKREIPAKMLNRKDGKLTHRSYASFGTKHWCDICPIIVMLLSSLHVSSTKREITGIRTLDFYTETKVDMDTLTNYVLTRIALTIKVMATGHIL